jgi:hypothetical protein
MPRRQLVAALLGVVILASAIESTKAAKATTATKAMKATNAAKAAELADECRQQVDSLCEASSADFNDCATCIRNNKDELMTNCNVGGYTLVQVTGNRTRNAALLLRKKRWQLLCLHATFFLSFFLDRRTEILFFLSLAGLLQLL